MYLCPYCGEDINQSTEICPHCNADLTQPAEGAVPAAPRSLRRVLTIWGIIIVAVAGTLWGFLWFVLPAQKGDPAQRAESGATASLGDLRAALADFAAAQPDRTYPASLEPLGNRARADAQLAQSVGYQLNYAPADPGPDGAIHGYSISARAGNYGYRNFYLDEGGTMRATKENRAANSHDPPL
jgi:hypothetical protein